MNGALQDSDLSEQRESEKEIRWIGLCLFYWQSPRDNVAGKLVLKPLQLMVQSRKLLARRSCTVASVLAGRGAEGARHGRRAAGRVCLRPARAAQQRAGRHRVGHGRDGRHSAGRPLAQCVCLGVACCALLREGRGWTEHVACQGCRGCGRRCRCARCSTRCCSARRCRCSATACPRWWPPTCRWTSAWWRPSWPSV